MKTLIARLKLLLLTPAKAWPEIAQERQTLRDTTLKVIVPLAAIPAVAGFIGMTLIGYSSSGVTVRMPLLSGLLSFAAAYAMSIVGIFAIAFIVDKLAKTFGGEPQLEQSLKLAAWSSAPGFVAGVILLLPSLSLIATIAGLYGLYLLFVGLPILKKPAAEKTVPYFVATLIVAVAVGALIQFLLRKILY